MNQRILRYIWDFDHWFHGMIFALTRYRLVEVTYRHRCTWYYWTREYPTTQSVLDEWRPNEDRPDTSDSPPE